MYKSLPTGNAFSIYCDTSLFMPHLVLTKAGLLIEVVLRVTFIEDQTLHFVGENWKGYLIGLIKFEMVFFK